MPRTKRTAAAASITAADQGPAGDESLLSSDAAPSPPVKRARRSTAGVSASSSAGAKKASATEKAAFAQPDPIDDAIPVPLDELVGEQADVLDLGSSKYPDVSHHVYEDYAFPDDDEVPNELREQLEGWEEYPEVNASEEDLAVADSFSPGLDIKLFAGTKTPTLVHYKAAIRNGVIPPTSTADVLLHEDFICAPIYFPLPTAVSTWIDPADNRYKGFKRATIVELTTCHAQPTLTIVRPKIKTDPNTLENHYEYPPNIESAPLPSGRAPLMETVVYALDPVTEDISPANVKHREFKHLEQADPYNIKCKQVTYSHSFERTTRNTGYVVQYPVKSRAVGVRTVWTIPPAARVPGGPTQFTLPDDQPSVFCDAIRPSMMPYIRVVLRPVRGCKYEQAAASDTAKPKANGYVWSLYLRTDKIVSAMQSTLGTTGYAVKAAVRQLLAAVGTARGWIYLHNHEAVGATPSLSVTLPLPPKTSNPIPDVSPIHFLSPQHSSLFMWMYTRERSAPASNSFNLVLSDVDVRHSLVRIADQLYYAPLSGLFSTSPASAFILAEPVPPVPITCSDMLVKCADTHPAKYTGVLALIKANPLMRPFPLPRADLELIPSRATLIVCSQVKVAHWAACAKRVFGENVVVLDSTSELLASKWEQVRQADVVIASDKFMFGAYDTVLGEVAEWQDCARPTDANAGSTNIHASNADQYAWADATARDACGGVILADQVSYARRVSVQQAAAGAAGWGGGDARGRNWQPPAPVGRRHPMEMLLLDLLRARDLERARGRRRQYGWEDYSDDEGNYYGDFGSGGYWSDEDDYYGYGELRRVCYDSDDDGDSGDGYGGRDAYDYDAEQEYYEHIERPAKEAEEATRLAAARAKTGAEAAGDGTATTAAAPAARPRPRPKGKAAADPRPVPTIEPANINRKIIINAPAHVSMHEAISAISARGDFKSTDLPVLLHALHWHRLVFDGVTRATSFAHVLGASKIKNTANKDFAPLRELHATSTVTFTGLRETDSEAFESSSVDALSTYKALGLRQGDEPPKDLPVRARDELIRQIGVHVSVADPDNAHDRCGPEVVVETITVYPSHHEHIRAVALTNLVKDSLEASVRLVQDHHVWFNMDPRKVSSAVDANREGRVYDSLSVRLWKGNDSYPWIKFANLLAFAQLRCWTVGDVIQDVIDPTRIAARSSEEVSMDPSLLVDGDWMPAAPHLGQLRAPFCKDEYGRLYGKVVQQVREELQVEPSGAAAKLLKALQTHGRETRLLVSQLEHDMRDGLIRARTRSPQLERGSYALPLLQGLVKRGFTLSGIKDKLGFTVATAEAVEKTYGAANENEELVTYSSKNSSSPISHTKDAQFHEAFTMVTALGLLWAKTLESLETAEMACQALSTMSEDVLKLRVPSKARDAAVWTEVKFGCSNCSRVFVDPAGDEANWFPCGRRGCSSCCPDHTAMCKKCLEFAKLPHLRLFYGMHVAARYSVEAEWERVLHARGLFTSLMGKCLRTKMVTKKADSEEDNVDMANGINLVRDYRHEGASEFVRIFGSKIQAAVLHVLKQLDSNPDAKFVAFTEYESQQHLLLIALHFAGIDAQLVLSDHSTSTYPPVARFKSNQDVRVLIVPFSKCDPDMNLVEATHVLLLHPYAGVPDRIVIINKYGDWEDLNGVHISESLGIQVTATTEQTKKEAKQREEWKEKELECLRAVINRGNKNGSIRVARFVLSHTREEDFEGLRPTDMV